MSERGLQAPVLAFTDVSFSYEPSRRIIEKLSFELPQGAFTGIIGPNGCGKSTLLRLATLLSKPQAGRIEVCGKDLSALSAKERARLISLLPQDVPAAPMTVRSLALCGRYGFHGALYRTDDDDEAAAASALETVGLESFAERSVGELSGGQRQRAYLAMSLVQDARIMLLDEPTSALDITSAHEVLGLVRDCSREKHATAIAALHDLDLALRYCDVLMLMEAGRVVRIANPAEMAASGDIERVFSVALERHEGSRGTSWSFFPAQ
ncbi:MAG: ABC transporter ATP-binding protein [Eggerthellaceae bacterium]|jgi:ABC-type cobalamin/Fe3+-siderophores transport system ATPase subunit